MSQRHDGERPDDFDSIGFFFHGKIRTKSSRPVLAWPDEAAECSAVSVRLTQAETDFGWVDLDLTFGERTTQITFCYTYDPFADLLDWLQAVRDGNLPIGVEIDDAGIVRVVAHAVDAHRLIVSVREGWSETTETKRVSALVDRNEFLGASARRSGVSCARN